ncbi:Zinc finger, DHHC-type, palmitoyltransferase [Trema orientale]|uniref:S-acyltransferase n=1 Tax=Trema orientale TaxID=63057 RepID=A0A2P5EAV7_TREOI|nr:Zinc finger, DHHC-type, palmitoyltransferase [Trema orientale]
MTILNICCCRPSRDYVYDLSMDRCSRCFPCLADPARRSALGLKVALVGVHLIYAAILFLFDASDFIQKTKTQPWYTCAYLLLFVATLVQYFITSSSSPGYVFDAIRAVYESNTIYKRDPVASKQPASSKYGSVVVTVDSSQTGLSGSNSTYWSKLVMDLQPPGTPVRTFTCSYCNVEQPPRAKHCQDCDKCVLQFDHHCVWLGTCIGQGNHCKFWWYLLEETALCLWTGFLYITYLKAHIARTWWKVGIVILLLIILSISLIFLILLLIFHSYLIMTNQTTFELVRRRRIHYLRGVAGRVHPFSEGVCRNIFNFCCGRTSGYRLEPVPTAEELEEKSRPYTCLDCVTCRCC